MNYNRQLALDFAAHARSKLGDLGELLDTFIEKMEKPDPKPEPELGICEQVLEAAAEMTNVSIQELSSGKKYGNLPSCKQLTALVLHELKCSDATIASKLPQMGTAGSVRSRRQAAGRYEKQEKSYRQVLEQLRKKFNIETPVI